jgi:hypothetical protein
MSLVPRRRRLVVRFASDEGRDVTIDLDGQADDGDALVDTLRSREWLPDDVTVETASHG